MQIDEDGVDDDGNDPWMRQFLAGTKRREERARDTGWGCFIAFALLVLFIIVLASGH